MIQVNCLHETDNGLESLELKVYKDGIDLHVNGEFDDSISAMADFVDTYRGRLYRSKDDFKRNISATLPELMAEAFK